MADSKLTEEQEKRVFEIYQKALELDIDARMKYIEEATEDEKKLKDAVFELVASSEQAERKHFMHTPAADLSQLDLSKNTSQSNSLSQENEAIPLPIGNYKPTRLIGEGGFGKVYLAEQSKPVSREVALKLIRHELIDERFIKRFEAERQMLAVLNHPNIAQIYDAGATDEGRPFLVMELVDGISLTKYCNKKKLGIRSRLKIFIQICMAIQHAHQKGVIHRDIKPVNILVTEQGGDPIPKVIDFGISKALDLKFNEKTVATIAEFFGSPSYMSPEQVSQNELDIDTRADVYSLGILLYELMTDSLPFSSKQSFIVLMNQIVSDEPTRPSIKISELEKEQLVNLNYSSRSKIQKDLAGDLDWIILKALEKKRDDRYASASAFAAEITRYLANEPVSARAPTFAYRTKKFIHRHIFGVMASAAILLVLIAGIVGTTSGYIDAKNESIKAQQQAETAQQTVALLSEFLSAVDPRNKGKDLKVVELLEAFKPRLEQLDDRPVVQASLIYTYAKTYRGLGLFDEAATFAERAFKNRENHLGEKHPATLDAIVLWAQLLNEQGKFETAEHWARIAMMRVNTNEVENKNIVLLRASTEVAHALELQGKYSEAEKLHRSNLFSFSELLGDKHPDTLKSKSHLATVLMLQQKLEEAEALFRSLLLTSIQVWGDDHPNTLSIMNELARVVIESGNLKEAESLYRSAFETSIKVLGSEHPDTVDSMSSLAVILGYLSQYEEAEELNRRAVEISTNTLGGEHPNTLTIMGNLAGSLFRLERFLEAEELMRKVWQKRVEILGSEHPATLSSLHGLASMMAAQGHYLKAKELFHESIERQRNALGNDHPDTLASMGNLAWTLTKLKDYSAAIQLYRDTLAIKLKVQGEDHFSTMNVQHTMANALLKQGEYEEAERVFRQVMNKRKLILGSEKVDTIESMIGLGNALKYLGRFTEAEILYQESLALQIKIKGVDHASVKEIRLLLQELSGASKN